MRGKSTNGKKNGKCRTCACQVLGVIRPACLRGVTGWLDAQGERRFESLPCAFDARRVLDAPPRHHSHGRNGYEHPGHYSHDKRCAGCGRPICNTARAHCRPCSSKINGAKRKGGPPNEAWRVSMKAAPRRQRQA